MMVETPALSSFVAALDWLSVLIFALTGALVASRAQLDLVGFVFMAALTAVGGGTVRDLVLGRDPVFWVARPEMVAMAGAAAFLVFWTAHLLESRARTIEWLDAMALSIAVPAGVGVAASAGFGPLICVIAGVVTGCFGGILRDILGNELPMVLRRRELYVTAAAGGAIVAVAAIWLGLVRPTALILGGGIVFVLRAGSILHGWRLPEYRPRPPRT